MQPYRASGETAIFLPCNIIVVPTHLSHFYSGSYSTTPVDVRKLFVSLLYNLMHASLLGSYRVDLPPRKLVGMYVYNFCADDIARAARSKS